MLLTIKETLWSHTTKTHEPWPAILKLIAFWSVWSCRELGAGFVRAEAGSPPKIAPGAGRIWGPQGWCAFFKGRRWPTKHVSGICWSRRAFERKPTKSIELFQEFYHLILTANKVDSWSGPPGLIGSEFWIVNSVQIIPSRGVRWYRVFIARLLEIRWWSNTLSVCIVSHWHCKVQRGFTPHQSSGMLTKNTVNWTTSCLLRYSSRCRAAPQIKLSSENNVERYIWSHGSMS